MAGYTTHTGAILLRCYARNCLEVPAEVGLVKVVCFLCNLGEGVGRRHEMQALNKTHHLQISGRTDADVLVKESAQMARREMQALRLFGDARLIGVLAQRQTGLADKRRVGVGVELLHQPTD